MRAKSWPDVVLREQIIKVSKSLSSLVKTTLSFEPAKRTTAGELLTEFWENTNKTRQQRVDLHENASERIKQLESLINKKKNLLRSKSSRNFRGD